MKKFLFLLIIPTLFMVSCTGNGATSSEFSFDSVEISNEVFSSISVVDIIESEESTSNNVTTGEIDFPFLP